MCVQFSLNLNKIHRRLGVGNFFRIAFKYSCFYGCNLEHFRMNFNQNSYPWRFARKLAANLLDEMIHNLNI